MSNMKGQITTSLLPACCLIIKLVTGLILQFRPLCIYMLSYTCPLQTKRAYCSPVICQPPVKNNILNYSTRLFHSLTILPT